MVPQEGHKSLRCFFSGLVRGEVIGYEDVPVFAGEVAEVGAHRLGEALVRHVPQLESAIAGWQVVGEPIEDENLEVLGEVAGTIPCAFLTNALVMNGKFSLGCHCWMSTCSWAHASRYSV